LRSSSLLSPRAVLVLAVLAAALGLAMLLALGVGPERFELRTVLGALVGGGDIEPWQRAIVLDIRLPRVLVAALGGGALALSGAALQGLFRNPLADPSVLGVSSGATLGAVLALYLGASTSLFFVPLASFVFALAAVLVVTRLAAISGRTSTTSLLLSGIAVASAGSALTSLVLSVSLAEWELGRQVLSWMMGGLEGRTYGHVVAMAPPILLSGIAMLAYARDLDALAVGEETASSIGLDVPRSRAALLILTSLATAAAVSVIGTVAFLGLVVPHVLRLSVRMRHLGLFVGSALGGALLLVVSDMISRSLSGVLDLRPGTLSSAIGAPFFLWLMVREQRGKR
jgi:iron complex transport system permease protein